MGLTVTEKGHWKDRIAKRINHRTETLVAKGDPTLLQRVAKEARARAYADLAIGSQQQELEKIEEEKTRIEHRKRRLHTEQCAVLNGTSVEEELEKCSPYGYDKTVENAVEVRAKVLEADILAESDLGRQILTLRAEKENLLDTVWLATSSGQIKELWEQVNALLELKPTALEKKALQIPPVQEG